MEEVKQVESQLEKLTKQSTIENVDEILSIYFKENLKEKIMWLCQYMKIKKVLASSTNIESTEINIRKKNERTYLVLRLSFLKGNWRNLCG